MEFTCRRADAESLKIIWQRSIDRNPGDERWVRWRDEYIAMNRDGRCATFIIFADSLPVGEGTLLIDPACPAVAGRPMLSDGKTTVNLNALRIEKRFEGQGHVSRMVKMMEDHARGLGFSTITIGVEEKEMRNRAIYDHWGYTTPVLTEVDEGEVVLYYSKPL
jgi:GNAT superfamily N-acetyltransferase